MEEFLQGFQKTNEFSDTHISGFFIIIVISFIPELTKHIVSNMKAVFILFITVAIMELSAASKKPKSDLNILVQEKNDLNLFQRHFMHQRHLLKVKLFLLLHN